MSSLTMVLALAAIQRGDHRRLRIWLLATALLGTVFIGGQVYEFTVFIHEGLNLSTQSVSASSFFVLTGFHGVHVTVGILLLLSLVGMSLRGQLPAEKHLRGRDRRPLLALRRHRLDRHLHRRLPRPQHALRSIEASWTETGGHRHRGGAGVARRPAAELEAAPGHRARWLVHGAEHGHPSPVKYVGIAISWPSSPAIEVGLYYIDMPDMAAGALS